MPQLRKKKKKKVNRIKQIPLVLLLIFIIAFRTEIFRVAQLAWEFTWGIVKAILDVPIGPIPFQNIYYLRILGFNIILGFGLVFLLWLVLISLQALLPVNSPLDVYRTAFHLVLHLFRLHGQAVFIKDGKKLATPKELEKEGSGVVVVDFNSAVVLEEQVPKPSLIRKIIDSFLLSLRLIDSYASPRVVGRGVVFTRRSERIREAVDLREQFRMRHDVHAYTRDGIELITSANAAFTIGQESDVLQITYMGERREQMLRSVRLENMPDGRIKVKSFRDELDDADSNEIHHVARVAHRMNVLLPYSPMEPLETLPIFNAERVFSAVFSQARDPNGDLIPWFDLPAMVAVDLFRELLSHIDYDDLYRPDQNDYFPLPGFKEKFRIAVRNQGILSYRLVFDVSGELLEEGRVYRENELLVSKVMPLTAPKVLRDRGIKVLASGFRELVPVSSVVYQQRLDTWRSKWDKETEILRANHELAASRVRSRARARAQREFAHVLTSILDKKEYSQEIMAVRVLQALEQVAADPNTHQLLPTDTIRLLSSVHNWLLPGEQQPPLPPVI